jgi:hypothetical protein
MDRTLIHAFTYTPSSVFFVFVDVSACSCLVLFVSLIVIRTEGEL